MNNGQVEEVVAHLAALKAETDVSKRLKEKTEQVIILLKSDSDLAVQKALLELEELNSFDMNSYHRTQVWDIVSMLESLNC